MIDRDKMELSITVVTFVGAVIFLLIWFSTIVDYTEDGINGNEVEYFGK